MTGVNYLVDGTEYFQPAKVVLLASYTYENTRLLLLSKAKAYPNGLSNNHGQVGRHYFSHHQGAAVSALFPFNLHVVVRPAGAGRGRRRLRRRQLRSLGPRLHRRRQPLGLLGSAADRRRRHEHLRPRARAGARSGRRSSRRTPIARSSAYIQKTTLPYEDNYLDLDPVVKDPLGFPVCRITGEYKENERAIAAFTQDKMEQWYREAGAIQIQRAPLGGAMGASTHAYGGTRMGDNPETNVVNRWGFSHEVPNLGVLGASVMGTSGARNPTLTSQALAWRTAEYLAKNWKSVAT